MKFRFPATLIRREVVIRLEGPNGSDTGIDAAAWEELMLTLEKHFTNDTFKRPDIRSLDMPSALPRRLSPVVEAAEPPENKPPEAELGGNLELPEADPPSKPSPDATDTQQPAADPGSGLNGNGADLAALAGVSGEVTKCERIFVTARHHDEKWIFVSKKRRHSSFKDYLVKTYPEISGVMTSGKPAILVAEGPITAVDKLRRELETFTLWQDVQVKHSDTSSPLSASELQKWRVFKELHCIPSDELRKHLVDIGHAGWYDLLLPPRTEMPKKKGWAKSKAR